MARMLLILTAAVIFSAALWPDHVRADDRKIAQQIANVMNATGKMKDYDILVTYSEGTAQLQGTVCSSQQMRTAIDITKASPHVNNVVNELSLIAESQNPVEIRPAAPLDRPVRISPVAAEKKPAARPKPAANTKLQSSTRNNSQAPQVVAASLRNRSSRDPAVQGRTVTPPVANSGPVLTAAVPPNQLPLTQKVQGPQSSRRVPSPNPVAFSRPVPMAPSALAAPAPGEASRPMMDPRMAQMDPRMAGMDPRMARMDPRMARMDPRMAQMDPRMARMDPRMAQMDPRMARMDPRMAQMDPRMAQMDPRMAQMDPRMAQMDPRMAQMNPRMAQMDPRMAQMDPRMAQMRPPPQAMGGPAMPQSAPRPGHERSALAALAAPLAVVAAPFAALSAGGQGQGQRAGPQPSFVPGTGGGVAPVGYDQPQLPAYAWPSYAPYPNYAALTYPKQYSPTAWPYIGPFYPYPQVPLGWRKVTLEWDDGWWFLDFKDK